MSRKKWIAVGLSLLVLPGAGHIYLGKKIIGYTIAIFTCGLVVALSLLACVETFFQTKLINSVTENSMAAGFSLVSNLSIAIWQARKAVFSLGFLTIGLIWVLSALDLLFKKPSPPKIPKIEIGIGS